ncbi:DUF2690 domain-containing protein [Streptomyces sp. NBC_00250]|uniref:DUF2690 domain-containing protein n=1 Tax=Streptomyces sp. NBC_00250 TaxID=2903641 RepID=UPI002E29324B|nr:DUF2690 domain-containing protein [Streptomyces sp. NBC_00250]
MRKRTWGRVGAAVVLLCLSQTLTTPQASADANAPGCYAETCAGKDPYSEGCDQSSERIAQLNEGDEVEVQLIYSYSCNSVWATGAIDPTSPSQASYYVALWSTPTIGGAQWPRGTTKWLTPELPTGHTTMGDWQGTNKACWNTNGTHWDPAPLDYEGTGGSMPRSTGACTAWQ